MNHPTAALPSRSAWPLLASLPLPRSRLRLPLLFLLALCCLAPPARAGRLPSLPTLVDLQVVDADSGQVLDNHHHAGQRWVAGEPGQRYAVRLRNRSGERVLAVLSVDGINAIDGRSAEPNQAGYVLGPWQTLDIDGWRKSLHTVARFVFDDPAASYAARTGRPHDIGVIGVAVFRERARVHPSSAGIARDARGTRTQARQTPHAEAASAPAAAEHDSADAAIVGQGRTSSPRAASRLGTAHGQIEGSQAYHTTFERQRSPAQISELRYDTHAALLARGIDLDLESACRYDACFVAPPRRPRAFPGHFVPDPH